MPLHFIEQGVKVDQAVYLDLLSEVVVPWVDSKYGSAPLVFQQDRAPLHTGHLVHEFCKNMFRDFWPKGDVATFLPRPQPSTLEFSLFWRGRHAARPC